MNVLFNRSLFVTQTILFKITPTMPLPSSSDIFRVGNAQSSWT